jgi:hypothetical protein
VRLERSCHPDEQQMIQSTLQVMMLALFFLSTGFEVLICIIKIIIIITIKT